MGTLPGGGCNFAFDGEHDGHGGFKATGIVTDNQLPGWLAISQPDIVQMMLGTNDVWNNLPTESIVTAFGTLVDQMRAQKPTMRVLVAKIPPMTPSGCDTCDWPGHVVALNDAITAWAPIKSTSSSPITVVDCWTGFVVSDFTDGVHPSESGTTKLANCWFEPLKTAILLAAGETVTSSTTVKSSSTTTLRTTTSVIASVSGTTISSRVTTSGVAGSTTTRPSSTPTPAPGGAPLYGQCGRLSHFKCKNDDTDKMQVGLAGLDL